MEAKALKRGFTVHFGAAIMKRNFIGLLCILSNQYIWERHLFSSIGAILNCLCNSNNCFSTRSFSAPLCRLYVLLLYLLPIFSQLFEKRVIHNAAIRNGIWIFLLGTLIYFRLN